MTGVTQNMTGLIHPSFRTLLVYALCCALFAGETRTWSQREFADFEKGVIKNLSVRSDGRLTLAPQSKEWFDTSSAYLWSLARDSKGNLYTGGGSGAKLFRIGPDGKGKVLAELDALEIHAIAVDSKDRIYAATAPDGKVYRVAASGKPEVFYDPKAKYIWALTFDSHDNLFIATGDQGEIHRVTPDGKGKVFFKCEETHVRSLTLDPAGNLIVGTEPGGLVLRVSAAGEGFVLYQMSKREVSALVAGRDGTIYAAGVGSRQAAPPASTPVATPPLPAQPPPGPGGARQANPPPALNVAPLGVTGGSDVFRIEANGSPRRVWTSPQDVVYAMALDSAGRVLLATGNKGNIYRIESATVYTVVLTVPATQVTAFETGAGGRLYAATGNVGKVYEIGPGLEGEGSLESDVFDAGLYTQWGRLSFEGAVNGGHIAIQTRSGNLDQPQKNWSPWSDPITASTGGRIASPPSRFVQWKAVLSSTGDRSPELNSVDVAYLPKNVEPHVDRIETTPANYRFSPSLAATQVQTLNLPPLVRQLVRGEAPAGPTPSETPATITPALQYAKGFIGARWMAADPNGDSLIYTLEIRGVDEKQWKPLKDKVTDKYYTWDSTAFPDGQYRIRVTASDTPSNPPAEALTGRLESDPFLIDNTPPRITGLAAALHNGKLEVQWHAADALNDIGKAEYSLDGGDWTVAAPTNGLSDSRELDYALTLDATPGEHTIAVRVEDSNANQAVEKAVVR